MYIIVYLFIEITLLNMNRISVVMASMLASSAVDHVLVFVPSLLNTQH